MQHYARKVEDTDVPRAKIVPCFPSGTLKSDEQQSTVAERPLLPQFLSCCPEDHHNWKMELAPYRCSVPHSPSLDPSLVNRLGGGCRRYDCEDDAPQRKPAMLGFMHEPCGITTSKCIANRQNLLHLLISERRIPRIHRTSRD